jgi:glycosyltransferase involved in cell wall biosynthesis
MPRPPSPRERMPRISICINTQTPLVQFPGGGARNSLDPLSAESVELARLTEGHDYRFSPGGVTRMVYPLIRRLIKDRVLAEAHWVSLNPNAPPTVEMGKITLHNVRIAPDRLAGYSKVKEAIWSRVHDLEPPQSHDDLFWTEAFAEYHYYNRVTAELIRELDGRYDFDAFYVHDFQQMPVGHMLGSLKPKLFRWHIPFDVLQIPEEWRSALTTYLDAYDAIVVSAQSYADSIAALHSKARVVQMYPFLDPEDYDRPSRAKVAEVSARFGIRPKDDVILLVGRMDPIKGQDLAIRAFAPLAAKFPSAKLVLVGNGSFSGSSAGLGLSKSAAWRQQLEAIVLEEQLEGRVVFTGHVTQDELDVLYERCRFSMLPSVREGFGLVAVESWLHGKPTIVTKRAGVAEMLKDGVHALLFDPDHPELLKDQMERLLGPRSGPLRARLARNGRTVGEKCSVDVAVIGERELLEEVTGP